MTFLALGRRLASGVFVIWIVISITFLISHVIPADPARAAAGLNAGAEQVEATAEALGLNDPVWTQYENYLSGLLHGDLGTSFSTRQPLRGDLLAAIPATFELVLWSMAIYIVLGIGVGLWWGSTRSRRVSNVTRTIVSMCVAMPVFWVALMLQMWLAGRLGWAPIQGRLSNGLTAPAQTTGFHTIDAVLSGQPSVFWDTVWHLLLPVTTLVIWLCALAARVTSTAVSEEWRAAYVRTARAKGASRTRTITHHIFRNAMNPVVTVLGMQFGWLLGGTVLVEVVFSWPGIGLYMFSAMQVFDYPVILAVTIVISVAFVIVNLIVDFLYPVLDPRLRVSRNS